MKVFVKFFGVGAPIAMQQHEAGSVADLRRSILARNPSLGSLRLLCAGKHLNQHETTLASLGIQKESTITCFASVPKSDPQRPSSEQDPSSDSLPPTPLPLLTRQSTLPSLRNGDVLIVELLGARHLGWSSATSSSSHSPPTVLVSLSAAGQYAHATPQVNTVAPLWNEAFAFLLCRSSLSSSGDSGGDEDEDSHTLAVQFSALDLHDGHGTLQSSQAIGTKEPRDLGNVEVDLRDVQRDQVQQRWFTVNVLQAKEGGSRVRAEVEIRIRRAELVSPELQQVVSRLAATHQPLSEPLMRRHRVTMNQLLSLEPWSLETPGEAQRLSREESRRSLEQIISGSSGELADRVKTLPALVHIVQLLERGALDLSRQKTRQRIAHLLHSQGRAFTDQDEISRSLLITASSTSGVSARLPHTKDLQQLLQHFGRGGLKHLQLWHGAVEFHEDEDADESDDTDVAGLPVLALATFDSPLSALAAFIGVQLLVVGDCRLECGFGTGEPLGDLLQKGTRLPLQGLDAEVLRVGWLRVTVNTPVHNKDSDAAAEAKETEADDLQVVVPQVLRNKTAVYLAVLTRQGTLLLYRSQRREPELVTVVAGSSVVTGSSGRSWSVSLKAAVGGELLLESADGSLGTRPVGWETLLRNFVHETEVASNSSVRSMIWPTLSVHDDRKDFKCRVCHDLLPIQKMYVLDSGVQRAQSEQLGESPSAGSETHAPPPVHILARQASRLATCLSRPSMLGISTSINPFSLDLDDIDLALETAEIEATREPLVAVHACTACLVAQLEQATQASLDSGSSMSRDEEDRGTDLQDFSGLDVVDLLPRAHPKVDEYIQAVLTRHLTLSQDKLVECHGCGFKGTLDPPTSEALNDLYQLLLTQWGELQAEGPSSNDAVLDLDQPILPETVLVHAAQNRWSCPSCKTASCLGCNHAPYHLGRTCEEWEAIRFAVPCTVCRSGSSQEIEFNSRELSDFTHRVFTAEDPDLLESDLTLVPQMVDPRSLVFSTTMLDNRVRVSDAEDLLLLAGEPSPWGGLSSGVSLLFSRTCFLTLKYAKRGPADFSDYARAAELVDRLRLPVQLSFARQILSGKMEQASAQQLRKMNAELKDYDFWREISVDIPQRIVATPKLECAFRFEIRPSLANKRNSTVKFSIQKRFVTAHLTDNPFDEVLQFTRLARGAPLWSPPRPGSGPPTVIDYSPELEGCTIMRLPPQVDVCNASGGRSRSPLIIHEDSVVYLCYSSYLKDAPDWLNRSYRRTDLHVVTASVDSSVFMNVWESRTIVRANTTLEFGHFPGLDRSINGAMLCRRFDPDNKVWKAPSSGPLAVRGDKCPFFTDPQWISQMQFVIRIARRQWPMQLNFLRNKSQPWSRLLVFANDWGRPTTTLLELCKAQQLLGPLANQLLPLDYVDFKDEHGFTALSYAVAGQNQGRSFTNIKDLLGKLAADVHVIDNRGRNLLMLTSQTAVHRELVACGHPVDFEQLHAYDSEVFTEEYCRRLDQMPRNKPAMARRRALQEHPPRWDQKIIYESELEEQIAKVMAPRIAALERARAQALVRMREAEQEDDAVRSRGVPSEEPESKEQRESKEEESDDARTSPALLLLRSPLPRIYSRQYVHWGKDSAALHFELLHHTRSSIDPDIYLELSGDASIQQGRGLVFDPLLSSPRPRSTGRARIHFGGALGKALQQRFLDANTAIAVTACVNVDALPASVFDISQPDPHTGRLHTNLALEFNWMGTTPLSWVPLEPGVPGFFGACATRSHNLFFDHTGAMHREPTHSRPQPIPLQNFTLGGFVGAVSHLSIYFQPLTVEDAEPVRRELNEIFRHGRTQQPPTMHMATHTIEDLPILFGRSIPVAFSHAKDFDVLSISGSKLEASAASVIPAKAFRAVNVPLPPRVPSPDVVADRNARPNLQFISGSQTVRGSRWMSHDSFRFHLRVEAPVLHQMGWNREYLISRGDPGVAGWYLYASRSVALSWVDERTGVEATIALFEIDEGPQKPQFFDISASLFNGVLQIDCVGSNGIRRTFTREDVCIRPYPDSVIVGSRRTFPKHHVACTSLIIHEASLWGGAVLRPEMPLCSKLECGQRSLDLCGAKLTECQHICRGVHRESVHPDCLETACAGRSDRLKQTLDSDCSICLTGDLSSQSVHQLACGHVFHMSCIKERLRRRWQGLRAQFSYLSCPLCLADIHSEALQTLLQHHYKLRDMVQELALKRLELEGLQQCKELTNPESPWHAQPEAFAMHHFVFYECQRCGKPYFGGAANCAAGMDDDQAEEKAPEDPPVVDVDEGSDDGEPDNVARGFDGDEGDNAPQNQNRIVGQRLCGDCSAGPQLGITKCKKHGTQFISWKCRFCCSLSVWHCFGSVHFCNACHNRASDLACHRTGESALPLDQYPQCDGLRQRLQAISQIPDLSEEQRADAIKALVSDPSTCPLGIRHPTNGVEYSLGCSMGCPADDDADGEAVDPTEK